MEISAALTCGGVQQKDNVSFVVGTACVKIIGYTSIKVKILSIRTGGPEQTVQIQIKLLLKGAD